MIIIELKKYYNIIKMNKIIFFILLSYSLFFLNNAKAQEKIKIGLLVPMTGSNKDVGQSIIKAVRLAVKDIDSNLIEIIPKTLPQNQIKLSNLHLN